MLDRHLFSRILPLLLLGTLLVACSAPEATESGPLRIQVTAPITHPAPTRPPGSPLSTPTQKALLPLPSPLPTSPLATPTRQSIPIYTYRIVNSYPHDPHAFTQGLVFHDGIFYEGTGLRGESTLRKVTPETGKVLQILKLPDQFFGEGITIYGDKIIQLTWQSRTGFVYDKESFEQLQTFSYPTEGWGITHDGERLIMSDGSSTLYFWDPQSLEEIGRIQVYGEQGAVTRLNELEYIAGEVYANIWQTDRIARINPQTGQVVGWIDLSGLLGPEDRDQAVDVLNGIAYDAQGERLFVTGKWWPKLFEIELRLSE